MTRTFIKSARCQRKEADMETIISDLVSRFEKGSLNRRELVQGLTMLAASVTRAELLLGLKKPPCMKKVSLG